MVQYRDMYWVDMHKKVGCRVDKIIYYTSSMDNMSDQVDAYFVL